ncbi:restriction endonuclease subunit S [Streptomyces yangpuensis]|uniref:restriction endonuclease subunit S n=1 Tax=Streptomyces yangpuensis TaxID=1648182 RepID=UPI0035DD569C
MSEWKTIPLTDVLDFQEGPGIMAKDFQGEGIPLLRLSGLKRGAPLLAGCNYLDPQMVTKRWDHFRLREGDVLLSTSASLGEVAIVDKSAAGAIAYTGIIRFRPKSPQVDPAFIECLLRSPTFSRQVEAVGVGSVLKHFGPTHLRDMTVNIPTLEDQRAIHQVLGALNSKISINDRIASVCFDLTHTHFRRSVQHDAVQLQVGDLVEFKYGKSLPEPDRREGKVPVYGCTGQVGRHDAHLTDGATVIVGRKGANAGHVSWSPNSCWVIDTAFYSEAKNANLSPEVAFLILSNAGLPRLLGDSAIPGLNRETALQHTVSVPESRAWKELTETAKSLFERANQAIEENLVIGALRDTLLPSLMSGQLQVKDAEKIVEDHV